MYSRVFAPAQMFLLFAAFLAWMLCPGLQEGLEAQANFAGCKPSSEKAGQTGCWILLSRQIGKLPPVPVYWSLDLYPDRMQADSHKGVHGIVTEALGKVWVFTVGEKLELPAAGIRMGEIGPIPVKSGQEYSVQIMEAVLPPGVTARTHRHPGPEVFYTESGQTCLETPEGRIIGEKGVNVVIPEGRPMSLTSSGKDIRRSIVLVLHASDQPWMSMAEDWKPKGLCFR